MDAAGGVETGGENEQFSGYLRWDIGRMSRDEESSVWRWQIAACHDATLFGISISGVEPDVDKQ